MNILLALLALIQACVVLAQSDNGSSNINENVNNNLEKFNAAKAKSSEEWVKKWDDKRDKLNEERAKSYEEWVIKWDNRDLALGKNLTEQRKKSSEEWIKRWDDKLEKLNEERAKSYEEWVKRWDNLLDNKMEKWNDKIPREEVAFTVSSETIHSTLPPVQQPPVAQSQAVQHPAAPPPVQHLEETKASKVSVDNSVPFTKAQNGVENAIQNGVENGLPAASVGNQSSQNDDPSSNVPSSNVTIGIVVGSILCVLALVFGILIFKRRKSRKTLSVSSDSTIDLDSNPRVDFFRQLDRSPSPKNQLSEESVRNSCFSSVLSSLNSEIYLDSEIYLELDE